MRVKFSRHCPLKLAKTFVTLPEIQFFHSGHSFAIAIATRDYEVIILEGRGQSIGRISKRWQDHHSSYQ
jgi:hypothetical protein